MSDKIENYIILKPISERFNKIANEITDDEIKSLIKEGIREQLSKLDFSYSISEICENWIENNQKSIIETLKDGIIDKLCK